MSTLKKNKEEIVYNLANSAIAGSISFLSALLAVGEITNKVFFVAFLTAALVALQKFKNYWDGEKSEYSRKILNFL